MNESLLNRILKDHKRRTRSLALILCLSMIVSLGTFAGFHKTAIAKVYTREVLDCPYTHEGAEPVAHVHNDDCYEGETLVCTLPERDAHMHDDTCYAESRMLSCGLEENPGHQHSEECFDENGELTCQIPEGEGAHVHTDDCYTIERALICNQPELPVHVHDAGCFRTEEITVDEPEETAASEQAVSTVPEMPVSDPNADLETADDWNREFENFELSGNWARDLVLVAATQQGRGESPNNFEAVLNDAGDAWVTHGYTRYGAWYGYPYAEWDAMFVSFCLRYAGIPVENVPNNPTAAFMAESFSMGELFAGRDYIPAVGDLIFFDTVNDEITNIDHMGIVYHVDAENGTINTVEGDRTDAVATFGYYLNDEQIVGYGILPQNPNYVPNEEENTDNTDEVFDGFIFMTTDEEEEPEETPATEDMTVPALPMPAQSWERTAGGIKVSVEAPEGAFPENTKIAVTPVNGSSLKDTVSDAVSGEVLEVQAVDITFFDTEGREIEPAVPIRVVMTPAATEHAEEKASVVHVDIAQQTAELIEQAEGTEFDNSEVVFDAEAFTIYAIVYTVDFEYEVNGKLFTSSMPGAEDMPLSEIVKGLGIVGEEELETFLSKIASVTSTNGEVAVVTEDRSVRVLKDGDARIVITMQDGAAFSIDVSAEGITEISDENAVATVSTVNDLYLPAAGEVKAELLTEEKSENAIAAVQTAAESSSYQAFSIALENVDVAAYDGFNVAVTLPEDTVVGRDFQLYQVKEDGMATDLTKSLTVTGEPNEDGLQNVSGISFTTEDFADFVLSYSIETYYTTAGGDTYRITLNYGPKAGIPDGADLEVREILPEDEEYGKYLNDSAAKLGVESGAVSFARFFDIEIKKDGEKIEPLTPVQVTISLTDAPAETAPEALKVVHFAEAGLETIDETQAAQREDAGVELIFDAESFSVYGVIQYPNTPSSASDLDGRAVKISISGYYLTTSIIEGGGASGAPDQFSRTSNADQATVWCFEAVDASAGKYSVYTYVDGEKKYMNLHRRHENSANAGLSDTPQTFTVSKENNSYVFSTVSEPDGGTYYLNHWGNPKTGFAGYSGRNVNDDRMDLNYQDVMPSGNNEYMVIVKRNEDGVDKYYIVRNDGTLQAVQYDESDRSVTVDDPMLWTYTGSNIYHHSMQVAYDGNKLPTDFYYRYIDPTAAQGWSEDPDDPSITTLSHNGQHVTARPQMSSTALVYENNRIRSTANNSQYIGVEEVNGTLKIKGQASQADAVEILFADAVKVPSVGWTHHTVNHIDISVQGTANADVPLAYGKYYDKNHNVVLEVTGFKKLSLTEKQVVDIEQLEITKDDMKRSNITATVPGPNGPVELDDAFYLAGYSANDAYSDGSDPSQGSDTVQVRIEGSFKVANLDGTEYETVDANRYYDPGKYNPNNNFQYPYDPGTDNRAYFDAVNAARKANKVTYTVTVVKPITFNLQMPDPNDTSDDPAMIQLYDADGHPLTVTADVSFASSFDFWDTRNECPPLRTNDYGFGETRWQAGEIWWIADRIGGCGMDFRLGADTTAQTKVYAVEITKLVVDENGNRIKSHNAGSNSFNIYKSSTATSDDVKDLNIGAATTDPLVYSDYSLQHSKSVTVGSEGLGLVYDYDVTPGVYYISEDPDSITEHITDTSGKGWDYKETYILTEYAWRNHPNDNYMHVSPTYSDGQGSYGSVPEILGDHPGYNDGETYTNDFLEFYVYNVYESPKVDVPVIKLWPAFDTNGDGAADPEDQYGWEASFKLQWAPLYEGESTPNKNFRDVTPVQSVTVTEENMAALTTIASSRNMTVVDLVQCYLSGSADPALTEDEISAIEAVTFKNLPKYGTDNNGNTYRIQYSLEETGYRVIKRNTSVVVYSWSETEGYNDPEESTHFQPFYPHDAGENESGHMAEQNEADANYYIQVRNAPKNIRENESIAVDLTKKWDSSFGDRQDDWYAEFELKRFVHTEYRDLSHMSDSDRAAEPITLTVKNTDNQILNTFEALPNLGLFLGANFKPHTEAKSVTFTAEPAVTLANGARISTITVTAEGSNASNALVRSQEFFVTHDTVFTLTEGAEDLIEGSNCARILDTKAGTPPLPDRTFSQTIRLDNSNEWTAHLEDLIRSETHAGDDDDQENVVCYEYYLVEKESNPDGYAQYFRAGIDGNPTDVLSGDMDHQIEHDDSIVALNGPSNRLIVKKLWRGVSDTTGFPAVYFTLYQTTDTNGNGAQPYQDENGTVYQHIELKGHNLEWICPVELPTTVTDSNGVSHNYYYYVQEDERSGRVVSEEGNITTSWAFYYYRSAFENANGQETARQTNAGAQGYQAYLMGSELAGHGGTITICNKMDSYTDMDIKKKFFELQEAGSWATVTQEMDRWRGTILGFKVIRAIKASDGKWLDESGNESDNPVWMDYSEEMRCGYDYDNKAIVDRGPDDVFYLKDDGGNWHFAIMNNWGDQTNIYAPDSGSGLPSYGFFIRNGEDIPVEYWYSFRETNVYKYVTRDSDGTIHVTDYPEWDWYSTITPEYAYGPKDSDGKVQKMIAFPHNVPSQDPDRISNFQASDLIIDKEWVGPNIPDAKAVYVKVWRQAEGGQIEDFTAIIADDIRNNQGWQNYVNTPDIIDLNRNCLVLTRDGDEWSEASLKINRALLGTINGQSDQSSPYHYYIQEIGYRTNSGEYRTDVNGRFKPLYNKWDPSREQWADAPVGMNDYASNNITIGKKGENRLKVINSTEPSTSYKVTKEFHGPQSSTGGQSSVTGKYPTDGSKQVVVELQQRYRYEKVTDGNTYLLIGGGDPTDPEDSHWKSLSECTEGEIAGSWLVDWQAAESASPVSVALPLDKPAGSILSNEAWYGSTAAWTYTWEGLDVTKTLAEEANPNNSRIAQLYYRAVEVSTPGWFNSVIAAEEQNGHMAVDDGSQTTAEVLAEKNTITNEREDCTLELNKEWTGLGEGDTWPSGYIVYYQLIQNFHLATAAINGDTVTYSYGETIKSVDMVTSYSDGLTADSVHPRAVSTLEENNHNLTLTGLPMYGFFTATEEDVAAAAEKGVTLTAGTVYPVVYTYSVKETRVTKDNVDVDFTEQTVDFTEKTAAEQQTGGEDGHTADGEQGTDSQTETTETGAVYEATLTNEMTSVDVTKTWAGNSPYADSVTVRLYRTKEIPADELCRTTINVSFGDNYDQVTDSTITATVGGKTVTLTKEDGADLWTGTVNLEKGSTVTVSFTAPEVNDGYMVTLNNVQVEVPDAETHTVDITGLVSEQQEGRTITVNVTWTDGNSHSATYNNLFYSGWSNTHISSVTSTNGSTQTFVWSGVPTTGNSLFVQLGYNGYNLQNQYTVNVTGSGYSFNNNGAELLLGDIPSGDSNVTITVSIDEKGAPPQGTASITLINNSNNGIWVNQLMISGTEYGKFGSGWLNSNASDTINNLPQGDYTVQLGVATVSQISGANSVDQWGSEAEPNVNIHITLADGESRTITVNALAAANSLMRSAGAPRMNSVRLTSNIPVLAQSATPSSVTVELGQETVDTTLVTVGADDYPVFTQADLVEEQTLNAANNWHYQWTGLAASDPETGAKYYYYVVEEVPANTKTVTYERTESNNNTAVTINNTPVVNPEYGSLKVTKAVVDEDNNALEISREFAIRLKQGDKYLKWTSSSDYEWVDSSDDATTWTFNNGGSVTFTGLETGKTYTVVEDTSTGMIEIDGYTFVSATSYEVTVSSATQQYEGTVTNTYKLNNIDLNIIKVDASNMQTPIKGAQFTLIKLDPEGKGSYLSGDDAVTKVSGVTGDNGITSITDIGDGYYEISETKIPDGYVVPDSGKFYIKIDKGVVSLLTKDANEVVASWAGRELTEADKIQFANETNTFTVGNTPGVQLPQTGGIGTTLFTALGGLMTATAGAILTIRRKRKPAEG